MNKKIDEEFKNICKEIIEQEKNILDWESIESSDMFQTKNYSGGFDSIEQSFCFSYYDENKKEYWFQLNLEEIKEVMNNKKNFLYMESADL